MFRIYKYFSYLSLDVALGAGLLAGSISKVLNGFVIWELSAALSVAVWIIYTFDHLADANKSKDNPAIMRHGFHRKHNKKISLGLVFATVFGIYLVTILPPITILYGLILTGFVIMYFLLVYFFKKFFLKEIFVAVVYALGVFLGPFSLRSSGMDFFAFNFLMQLLVIALLNLLMFSFVEVQLDIRDNHPSLVIKVGKKNTKNLMVIMFCVLLFWQSFSMIFLEHSIFQLSFLLMTIVLVLTFIYHKSLMKNDVFRWLGDSIFFIPAIELLI